MVSPMCLTLCWPRVFFFRLRLFPCFHVSGLPCLLRPLWSPWDHQCALNRESYNVQKFGLCHFAPLHISVYPLIFALLVEREYRRRFFVFPPECENARKYPVWSAAP